MNSYLLGLLLVVVLPIIGSAGMAAWKASGAYFDSAAARLAETSHAFAHAVEVELEHHIAYVSALSANRAVFGPADLDAPGRDDSYREISGRLALLSEDPARNLQPVEREAAALLAPAIARAKRAGRAIVSDLFLNPWTGAASVAVIAPWSAPDVADVIALIVPPDRLLSQPGGNTGVDATLLIAVTDSKGMIVVRSRDVEKRLGRRVPGWDRVIAAGTRHGLLEVDGVDGGKLIMDVESLSIAEGWVVVAAEPIQAFEARWYQPLKTIAAGILAAVVMALLAGAMIARTILRPVGLLAARAEAIATGSPTSIAISPSPIAEFERLRTSLETSETTLRDQAAMERDIAARLSESERRYRALAHAGALVFWRADRRGRLLEADGWAALTGQSKQDVLGSNWLKHVLAEDRAHIAALHAREMANPSGLIDIEFRVRKANGSLSWVRGRGVLIDGETPGSAEWIGVLEDVDTRRKAQAHIAHMAQHDALTGLGNRTLLNDALAAVIADRGRHESAVLYLDLDHFKTVNDTLGHSVGDALLRAIGERLQAFVTGKDTAARLGGDEFALLVHEAENSAVVIDLARRIIAALAEPFLIAGQTLRIGGSIGIAFISDADTDVDTILKNADLALYQAKDQGRGQYRVFERAMADAMQERHRLEGDLRAAIPARQFEIYYQPIVDLAAHRIVAFEALLRWNHPELGMISPATFIPIAEEAGLIEEIGGFVLREATLEATRWPPHYKLAVNVSPHQLLRRDFVDVVVNALQNSGLAAARLELEITETALVENTESTMAAMLRLRLLGCSIAMDDFGTGYSSLSYLRSFSFDKVKIDRSFVKDLEHDTESRAIVSSILDLCDALGIKNTAEGVETEAQATFLKENNCAFVQGFLYGSPMPAGKLHEVMAVFGEAPRLPPDGAAWYRDVG